MEQGLPCILTATSINNRGFSSSGTLFYGPSDARPIPWLHPLVSMTRDSRNSVLLRPDAILGIGVIRPLLAKSPPWRPYQRCQVSRMMPD